MAKLIRRENATIDIDPLLIMVFSAGYRLLNVTVNCYIGPKDRVPDESEEEDVFFTVYDCSADVVHFVNPDSQKVRILVSRWKK